MGIKNLVISQKIGSAYSNVKEKLGNDKVGQNLKASHGKGKEKLAQKDLAKEGASVRKSLGVDKSTYESILSGEKSGYFAKDVKHAERLYDRAVGATKSTLGLLSSAGIFDRAQALVNDGIQKDLGSADINKRLHADLLTRTLSTIDAANLGPNQTKAAKALATGLIQSMHYHEGAAEVQYKAPSKSFRTLGDEQANKRNSVQRFVDREAVKISNAAGLLGAKAASVTTRAKQLGNTAVRKTYNAATSAVAGTAVGVGATAAVVTAPVALTAKATWNLGAGIVDGFKAAGSSISRSTSQDAKNVRAQFKNSDEAAPKTRR